MIKFVVYAITICVFNIYVSSLKKKNNDVVNVGDVLATCYTDKYFSQEINDAILNAFTIN